MEIAMLPGYNVMTSSFNGTKEGLCWSLNDGRRGRSEWIKVYNEIEKKVIGVHRCQFRAIFLPVWEIAPPKWPRSAPVVIIKEWFVLHCISVFHCTFRCPFCDSAYKPYIVYAHLSHFLLRWELFFIGLTPIMAAAVTGITFSKFFVCLKGFCPSSSKL